MWVLHQAVHWFGLAVLCVTGVFCLATGLYTAAEWLEDHVKTTYRLIKRGTIACLGLQLLWLVLDRQFFWPNVIGLVSHANSWWMLKHYYPSHMGMDQPPTILALVLLVVHQTSWVLAWAHEAGSLLSVAAILATVVWPIPIMLLLSAGTDSDLPTRMPPSLSGHEAAAFKGTSIPNSPLGLSQPSSPFVDTARLRMRHSLQHRSGSDAHRLSADTAFLPDQAQAVPLASMHSRKGSGGSEGSGSFSSSMSGAWGLADRIQQQPGFKKHRSRFVQAMHKLQQLAGVQPAGAMLPVADSYKR